MKKIILLETLAPAAHEILHEARDVQVITAYNFDLSGIDPSGVEALITRGKGRVTAEVIDRFPELSIVARAGVGLDNIDIPYASSKKIRVLNNPGVNSQTVAEHALSLMLMLQRNMYRAVEEVKRSNWAWRNQFQGDEIYGKTLGIIGMGTIGKIVAGMARAFGMKVIHTTIDLKNDPDYRPIDDLLAVSDIISCHIPLTPETRNFIDATAFKKMKNTAILINTARGEIIDEQALTEALKNGQIAGYGADVMSQEPPSPENELVRLPNVLITAHLASLTSRTYTTMCVDAVNNVLALLRNEEPMKGCIFNLNQL